MPIVQKNTVKVKVEPSDLYQTLEQNATKVSKEKITQRLEVKEEKVFISIVCESIWEGVERKGSSSFIDKV